ncbi:3-hydroxyisobutyryl-CoA hydrolase [Corynebacterium sp. USCH3]|uniref:3-hydroxyisobutyryl-CoA hydrolase n=1 Tax=Corynebacterium sp. USCH3 TaxID=3024840 RepID=UPI0030AA4194
MDTTPASQSPLVRVESLHGAGVITLDRPKALNALNHEMITAIAAALEAFRHDDAVDRVLLCSAGEKAYCAGGDVRSVRDSDLTGDFTAGDDLFRDEYDMNHALASFPKPTVAVVDGIAMGGGLGVSAHADIRVITDRTWQSMPEMAIGFITDVGISHAFTHLPNVPEESRAALGLFLATTGYRLTPDDLLWSGLATHLTAEPAAFRSVLVEDGTEAALSGTTTGHGDSVIAGNLGWITATFSGEDWSAIERRVGDAEGDFADGVRGMLAPANPLSLVAATALLNHAARSTLREALDAELALGKLLRRQSNFPEGVRAVLVDKDRQAHFDPATTAEVTETQVAEIRRTVERS